MTCLRLLSLSGLLYAILACPVQAQVLTGGPYRVGDTILNNGVAEQVVAGPFVENHARSQAKPPSSPPQLAPRPGTSPPVQPGPPRTYPYAQPVPAYPPRLPYLPPYQPLPPAPYQPPIASQPVPVPPAATDDGDNDPNCCIRPGSELWEQMVDLIRENARLEATVGKLEELSEMRLDAAAELADREQRNMRAEQAEMKKAAEREVEKLHAQLRQLENETSQKMEATIERTTDLEKQLSTTKHHLDEAREREQAWDNERQKLLREISELKKRRK